MTDKVMLTLADLGTLAVTADRNGTQGAFMSVAMQWAGEAQKEIQCLRALVAPSDVMAWPIQGVRVDGDTVIISVKGGNDTARWLCAELVRIPDAARRRGVQPAPVPHTDGGQNNHFEGLFDGETQKEASTRRALAALNGDAKP